MSSWHWLDRPAKQTWVKTGRGWQGSAGRVAGNVVVPAGEVWILDGVSVQGSVQVQPTAALVATNAVITGRLECSIEAAVNVIASTVRGSFLSFPSKCSPGRHDANPAASASLQPQQEPDPAHDMTLGQFRLTRTTVQEDIRCVAPVSVARPRPQLLLGAGTVVRGYVLVAGVDVAAEHATVHGGIWRTDATNSSQDSPALSPVGRKS